MFAIIETGGKQYQVEEGRYVDVELLDVAQDKKVTFDKIVMVVDGEKSKIGQPYLKDATVEAKVMKHDKDKKIIVFKQRPKKGYRKKQGHRQSFTRVMVEKIALTKKTPAKKAETAEAAPTAEAKPKAAPKAAAKPKAKKED